MKAYVLRDQATGTIFSGPRRPLYSRIQDARNNVDYHRPRGRTIELVEFTLGEAGEKVVATFSGA